MIADSAATISAVPDASDLDTRTGTRRVLMADNSVQDTPEDYGIALTYRSIESIENYYE